MDGASGYLDDLPGGLDALQAGLRQGGNEGNYSTSQPSEWQTTLHDGDAGDVSDSGGDTSSMSSYDSEKEHRLAQQQWEESLEQFETILTILVLPLLGRTLGRKWGFWAFSRYKLHGLAPSFFGLTWLFTENSFIPSSLVAFFQG